VVYQAGSLKDLESVYQQVIRDLGTVYSLGYRPANRATTAPGGPLRFSFRTPRPRRAREAGLLCEMIEALELIVERKVIKMNNLFWRKSLAGSGCKLWLAICSLMLVRPAPQARRGSIHTLRRWARPTKGSDSNYQDHCHGAGAIPGHSW